MYKYNVNSDLVEDLAERKVAFFLGAGVSASSLTVNDDRLPTWEDFLKGKVLDGLAKKDERLVKKYIQGKDYLMAAEVIRDCIGDHGWKAAIENCFLTQTVASDLQKAIASFSPKLVITTNFDKSFETFFASSDIQGDKYPKVMNGLSEECFALFRDDHTYLIKLHGTVDNYDSLIFTRSDYNKKAYGSLFYKQFIETLLLTHTVVFIGFSMDDPAVAQCIEIYARNYGECRPHYLFTRGPVNEREKKLSRDLRKIYIVEYGNSKDKMHSSLLELMSELKERADEHQRSNIAEQLAKR